MGVLDDAIRDHLELKRQHGAPDEEVHRQESEALGPARREEPAAEPAEVQGGPESDAGILYDDHTADETQLLDPSTAEPLPAEPEPAYEPEPEPLGEPTLPEEVALEDPAPADQPGVHEESFAAEPAKIEGDPLAEEALPEHEVPDEHEPPFEPGVEEDAPLEPPTGDTPPQGFSPLDQPTEEHPPPPPPGAEEDEDVLEETPDFLQETPEHDRLWFEQKPPRDFDFDD